MGVSLGIVVLVAHTIIPAAELPLLGQETVTKMWQAFATRVAERKAPTISFDFIALEFWFVTEAPESKDGISTVIPVPGGGTSLGILSPIETCMSRRKEPNDVRT